MEASRDIIIADNTIVLGNASTDDAEYPSTPQGIRVQSTDGIKIHGNEIVAD